MTKKSEGRRQAAAWTVALGPGTRLAGLGGLARALSDSLHGDLAVAIESVDDLAGLLLPRTGPGRLILDGDALPEEDLGFVRRFLAAQPDWSLLLVGEDAGRRTARTLLAWPRTGWLAWPPDLGQLEDLVRAPERILPRPAAAVTVPAAASPAEAPQLARELAELTSLARTCELAAARLREKGKPREADLDQVSSGVARVRRLAQSLSYLAAPPAPGSERIDLGALLEDELASLTLRGRDAPRFLYRGEAGLEVQADREALTVALEAVLLLARGCTPEGEVVRVQLAAPPAASGSAEIGVEFLRGPLAGLALERVCEPHALVEVLPDLGPNDLASARAVLEAHGGRFDLAAGPENGVIATLALPARVTESASD